MVIHPVRLAGGFEASMGIDTNKGAEEMTTFGKIREACPVCRTVKLVWENCPRCGTPPVRCDLCRTAIYTAEEQDEGLCWDCTEKKVRKARQWRL